ncbi:precorrin-4 C(11)-methyltransferase [Oleidesulfovibrio sp.]|uniref:precorrin-4 C(11)-methyltransferase n=1 Tax=Oleidesulfovibrio sp. TaxID=2909707 RepID=UPI003A8A9854
MANNAASHSDEPKVWFIGAGPGDPELITVKGQRLISQADLVLYAGSLVPPEVIACARDGAQVADSAPLNLQETHNLMMQTVRAGGMVARVHTGDPSLYGAIREQMALLDLENVRYAVVPGVTSAFAAAAAANVSLTLPEITQSFIITRVEGRTPVPEAEKLRNMAKRGAAMAIYLSASLPETITEELRAGGLGDDTRIIAAYRVGWPQQRIIECTLGTLTDTVRNEKLQRQTVFLVLPGNSMHSNTQSESEAAHDQPQSKLYDASFTHGWRKAKA